MRNLEYQHSPVLLTMTEVRSKRVLFWSACRFHSAGKSHTCFIYFVSPLWWHVFKLLNMFPQTHQHKQRPCLKDCKIAPCILLFSKLTVYRDYNSLSHRPSYISSATRKLWKSVSKVSKPQTERPQTAFSSYFLTHTAVPRREGPLPPSIVNAEKLKTKHRRGPEELAECQTLDIHSRFSPKQCGPRSNRCD